MDKLTEDMVSQDENVRIAYLKAFTRLASTDGNFDENERAFIKSLIRKYQIAPQHENEILEEKDTEAVIEGVKLITNRRMALELIKELCILAHADDVLTDDETVFIGRVGQAMGVELDKIEQISNWVIDKIILAEEAKIIFEEV